MLESAVNIRPRGVPLAGLAALLRLALPEGCTLPEDAWTRRHRAIVVLLWLHVIGIAVFALLAEGALGHGLAEAAMLGGSAPSPPAEAVAAASADWWLASG
jgi:hypothetical protein